ncbi:MAG: PEP-CTERM system histidine kinase PrsK [Rhodocyclales bacterium CG_4_9_14_3_um_filter_68_10]|nr:MAG: PEP-CTERM system histidine kinase PrsK [Rhodocyclales bacterium CG_4_9_14_3_um_filter_68_10]
MNTWTPTLATWGYGLAAAAFAAFAAQLALAGRGNLRGRIVFAAIVLSAGWASSVAAFLATRIIGFWVAAGLFDALRLGAWLAFAVSTIRLPDLRPGARPAPELRSAAPAWIALGAFIVVDALVQSAGGYASQRLDLPGRIQFALPLAGAILALVLVEQAYRNIPAHARWGMKPLCLGLAGVFAFDLYLYAEAFLFSRMDLDAWTARGPVHAMLVPFVAVSAARNREWSFEIAVSRRVVFHSAALLGAGLYLLLVAAAGYFLRFFGGSWGRAIEITFVFAALLGLASLVLSGSLRSKLRVFLTKNFFSYRYDYREEWLRITRTLSSHEAGGGLREAAIKALADLLESPGGSLWLRKADGPFVPAARWNVPETRESEAAEGGLAGFLAASQWVVDLDEWRNDPEKYEGLVVPGWLMGMKEARFIVPLTAGEALIGFVVLSRPRARVDVNWEVNDLLKTAGRQAASYLAQMQAVEALLEAKKFDAFNRMSAFVVHDLKNLVAQLSLLLKNAQKHHDNPEFRKDMLETIDHVVERMKNLLLQLRAGTTPVDSARPVDLAGLIGRIARSKGAEGPAIELDLDPAARAAGHEDRLERVIGHLVQNALDATGRSGRVWVRLWREGDAAKLEVGDTGPGMSEEFVRNRLFKPFQSTKAAGMGIGAYESAQYIAELGGTIAVESQPNVGTRMRIVLPLIREQETGDRSLRPASPPAPSTEAAA